MLTARLFCACLAPFSALRPPAARRPDRGSSSPTLPDLSEMRPVAKLRPVQSFQQIAVDFRLQLLDESLVAPRHLAPDQPGFLQGAAVHHDGRKRPVDPVENVINAEFFGNVIDSHAASS